VIRSISLRQGLVKTSTYDITLGNQWKMPAAISDPDSFRAVIAHGGIVK
jgi:hypothetical protein